MTGRSKGAVGLKTSLEVQNTSPFNRNDKTPFQKKIGQKVTLE